MNPALSDTALWQGRWQRFSAAAVHAFHVYANWLVSITWRRFIVLCLGLLVFMAIVHDLPPFTWTVTERIDTPGAEVIVVPKAPRPPNPPAAPKANRPGTSPTPIETPGKGEGLEINIGRDGIHITPKSARAPAAASASAAPAEAAAARATDAEEEAREAREEARQATREAEEARAEAQQAMADLVREQGRSRSSTRVTRAGVGDAMMQFTLLWIVASAILKFTYKGRMQAEVKAAQATETAEAESLKRQVVEARMAAMQAQVEPHFLFNTLASIDHLIETDPARASVMQKNLIALLRASMPTMREANDGGVRDLGRELAVIRPYLEILKVRMEERLATEIAVPEGLLSAQFPPMMIQTLVENAIKHGLEPKAEGGSLRLAAEIVHGKLQVTVADTGLGFGKAATAGTGVGLANIRERLQLLYGPKAALTVAANQPSGTVVTITVPYRTIEGAYA
jgi:hypothetical protein